MAVFVGATKCIFRALFDIRYNSLSFVDTPTVSQSEFFVIDLGSVTIENAARAFANAYSEEDSLDNAKKFLKNFY